MENEYAQKALSDPASVEADADGSCADRTRPDPTATDDIESPNDVHDLFRGAKDSLTAITVLEAGNDVVRVDREGFAQGLPREKSAAARDLTDDIWVDIGDFLPTPSLKGQLLRLGDRLHPKKIIKTLRSLVTLTPDKQKGSVVDEKAPDVSITVNQGGTGNKISQIAGGHSKQSANAFDATLDLSELREAIAAVDQALQSLNLIQADQIVLSKLLNDLKESVEDSAPQPNKLKEFGSKVVTFLTKVISSPLATLLATGLGAALGKL